MNDEEIECISSDMRKELKKNNQSLKVATSQLKNEKSNLKPEDSYSFKEVIVINALFNVVSQFFM